MALLSKKESQRLINLRKKEIKENEVFIKNNKEEIKRKDLKANNFLVGDEITTPTGTTYKKGSDKGWYPINENLEIGFGYSFTEIKI